MLKTITGAAKLRRHARYRLLEYLGSRFAEDPPSLALVFPDGYRFAFVTAPDVVVTFHSPAPVRMLLRGNFVGLGDAYVQGQVTVEGAVDKVVQSGIRLADRLGRSTALQRIGRVLSLLPRRHSRRQDAADISYHYDVSNAFYRLWLDDAMVYSCAYFRTGTEDIHTAQRQKLDHICRKLMLDAGHRVLDMGCGWGGLLERAAQRYGVSGVGITLSKPQADYARARLAVARLDCKVEIREQDYRDIDDAASYDRIVSIGMYEHVGMRNLPSYFDQVARLLRPGGAMLHHGIVATDPHGRAQGPAGGEFIGRYVFPGGAVPHLSRTMFELSRVGLEVADVEDLRPHYAQTLLRWVRRLEEHREEAIALAGLERYRIWRVYLAGMACAFDRGWLSVAQVLAFKPDRQGVVRRPWTRDYQYVTDEAETRQPPMAGRLDWHIGQP